MLLRYLIVSIEDLKAQIVAYKEQVIKGQGYTDDLLNDKVTYIADIVDHIDDNITPKTKIKAKNSSKKSE